MNLRPLRKRRVAGESTGAPRKKRRLKYINLLPSFITLMNGACGFISIVTAGGNPEARWQIIRGVNMNSFMLAGYLIFLAMVADMLDGRVARLTRTTSSFGGQLDSLSDIISFGVAPAFLMYKLAGFYLARLRLEYGGLPTFAGRGLFFSAVFYVMCAAVRLARFNVENDEDESAHMVFSGLPSPGAAGVVASLVVFQQQVFSGFTGSAPSFSRVSGIATAAGLPVITLLAGILMVSRIRYPHPANRLLRGKRSLGTLLAVFASLFFIVWKFHLAAVTGFCGFALFGVVRSFFSRPPVKAPPPETGAGS